jgi:23S rRNA (uracil1939-C5)-methyltransferase
MARSKKPAQATIEHLAVTDLSSEGKGVARHEGLVVFVQGGVPGDVVDVQVLSQKKNFQEAKIAYFHQKSALRSEPYCQHFGYCGGCKLQHVAYAEQLQFKHKQVLDALQRLGKVSIGEVEPILPAAQTRFYRNKLQYSFCNKRWFTPEEIAQQTPLEGVGAGFHVPGRFDKVLDIEYCHHQVDPSNQMRLGLKNFALQHGFSFYDVWLQRGLMRTITIRSTSLGEWMLIVQVGEPELEAIGQLMEYAKTAFPFLTSLFYVINQKGNDTYDDLDMVLCHGRPYIREQMENLVFHIGPKSFFQTNSAQAVELYRVARQYAGLTGREVVYDLYTGTGTIACFVAHQAQQVIGVEYVPSAIEDAKVNAQLNGIGNTKFYAGDLAEVMLAPHFLADNPPPDVVITDPPRTGMHPLVVDTLLSIACPRIVYVSCNPATQARDLAGLDAKYAVKKIRPVDMFPQTAHVENVALLELR